MTGWTRPCGVAGSPWCHTEATVAKFNDKDFFPLILPGLSRKNLANDGHIFACPPRLSGLTQPVAAISRSLRGGSWENLSAWRLADRGKQAPLLRANFTGFRLARSKRRSDP